MTSFNLNIRGVIAVQNHGGSGTLFLQSLLDEHPEILSLPALYGRELIRFWFETKVTGIEKFAVDFVNSPYHRYWFDADPNRYKAVAQHGLHRLGDNKNENIAVDRDTFAANLILELSKGELNLVNYIIAVYIAYAKTRRYKHADNCWIMFPFHQNPPEYAKLLAKGFKNVKFIHMVREPVQCLSSAIRFESKQDTGRTHPYWTLFFINPNPGASPLVVADNVESCAVRLEDLHAKPEKTLRTLCRWLDISWNPILLQSTYNGKKWWNRPELLTVNGFSKAFTRFNGKDIFPWFDKFRMEFIFTPWKKNWNYKIPFYVKIPLLDKLVRLFLLFPFKIDFLPLKIPASMKKVSVIKLLFVESEQPKESEVVVKMKVNVPVRDPVTNELKVCEFVVNEPKKEPKRGLRLNEKMRISFVNLRNRIKQLVEHYPEQYNNLKEGWRQRKLDNNLVKLLPIEDE